MIVLRASLIAFCCCSISHETSDVRDVRCVLNAPSLCARREREENGAEQTENADSRLERLIKNAQAVDISF
jgi:hypothetical protein